MYLNIRFTTWCNEKPEVSTELVALNRLSPNRSTCVDGEVMHWSNRIDLVTKLRCVKCGEGGVAVKEETLQTKDKGRMAQHQNRSNHVRVDNLPPNMTDCRELLSQLELGGNVQVKI